MIKVVQFIHGLSIGGAETLVKNYCLLFNKEKIDITLICLMNHHSVYDEQLKNNRIKVIYIYDLIDKKIRGPAILKKIGHRLFGHAVFRYILYKIKPDIIHSHLYLSSYVKFGAPKSSKLFYTIHSDIKVLFNGTIGGYFEFKITKQLVVKRGMRIITLHKKMREEANLLFGIDNALVLNNGVCIEQFRDIEDKQELKKRYGVPDKSIIFGNIGRLALIKNHEFLIDVFGEISKNESNAYLWLIGDGPLANNVNQKVKHLKLESKVVFWGIRSDIPQLIKMMDLMIMPSIKEGLSVSLIEAQIAGVPALISDSIEKETAISNLIHFLPLIESKDNWAKIAIEIVSNQEEPVYTKLSSWDIRNVVDKLEKLYLSELRSV